MSVKIRLMRVGKKKQPSYRVVVADERSPRDGRFIEKLGSYNPMLPSDHAERVRLQDERITHWLGQGALATDRVARFLGRAGLAPMPPTTAARWITTSAPLSASARAMPSAVRRS